VLRWRRVWNTFRATNKLLQELRSADNALALILLEELKERQLLQTGALEGIDLTGVRLSKGTFAKGRLRGAIFSHADLTYSYFYDADLQEAVLTQTDFSHANLRQIRLDGASAVGAQMIAANLARASLVGCSLREANLTSANFWTADLRGADLSGALVEGANFHETICDSSTRLPDGERWSSRFEWHSLTRRN